MKSEVNSIDPDKKASQLDLAVMSVLQSLGDLLKAEETSLDNGGEEFAREYSAKKIRMVNQLQLVTRNQDLSQLSKETRTAIVKFKTVLSNNTVKLERRIMAINELNTTIRQAVSDGESDGTYNAMRLA
jgi:hypothetical protein